MLFIVLYLTQKITNAKFDIKFSFVLQCILLFYMLKVINALYVKMQLIHFIEKGNQINFQLMHCIERCD